MYYRITEQKDGKFTFEKTTFSINAGKKNENVQRVYDLAKEEIKTVLESEIKFLKPVIEELNEQLSELVTEINNLGYAAEKKDKA